MLPSPTQPPPVQTTTPQPSQQVPEAEQVPKTSTPARRRAGQTLLARFVKAIFRPILKVFYYIIRWIRGHSLVTLAAIVLLVGSFLFTSYFLTGALLPFSTTDTIIQQDLNSSNPQVNPNIQSWITALRDGDASTMLDLQKSISASAKQPDSALYIIQFSEKQGQVKWTSASVTSIKTAADGMVDTFIEVDMTSTNANTSGAKLMTFWHFVTAPITSPTSGGQILAIEYISTRQVG